MRRKERQVEREQAEKILSDSVYGVLSMNGTDCPYGVPLSHVYINGALYFHCAAEGRKLMHLRIDSRVSFCAVAEALPLPVVFSMRYQSAVLSGKAEEVTDSAEKLKILAALVEKYSGLEHVQAGKTYAAKAIERTAVFKIKPDRITGKVRK